MKASETESVAQAPWSRLWRKGVLHSCATGFQDNYSGEIAAFWREQFARLRGGECVVDLATGNGAVLLLARESASERGITVSLQGVDLADIDPASVVADGVRRYAGIVFHPRTSADALPFEAQQVDLLCAQFGFEYAPRERTLQEIQRVLSPRGRIAMIMHSDDSIVAEMRIPQQWGLAFLREDCPVIAAAAALVPVLHQAAQGVGEVRQDPAAEQVRRHYNATAQSLISAIEQVPRAQVLKNVALQLRQILAVAARSPQQALQGLEQLQQGLEDEAQRLEQLHRALVSESELQAVIDVFAQAGLRTRYGNLIQQGTKMGWTLEAWHE